MDRVMREDYNKLKTTRCIYGKFKGWNIDILMGNTTPQQVREFNYLGNKTTENEDVQTRLLQE